MWAGISRRRLVAGLFASLAVAAPAPNRWNKLRYQGGTFDAKVNPFDWNTTLTLLPGQLELVFAGRKRLKIPLANVVALSYGQKAYRRIADLAVLSLLVTPGALFGLLHKSKDHLVAIEYKGPNGEPGGVLLTAHKDVYRELLQVLKMATGKPVENWP